MNSMEILVIHFPVITHSMTKIFITSPGLTINFISQAAIKSLRKKEVDHSEGINQA
jgi:hypothetical protein